MSKFFNLPVVGIDVSADFSMVAILAPNGDIYRKAFKINNDIKGFSYLVQEMRKVEEEFSLKPVIFMESTGIYHLTLFHFLKHNELKAFVINPLVTNSNKNFGIRKVKNDKKDALSIANIGKYQDIKMSDYLDVNIFAIRSLCRDYYGFVDNRSQYKKKLCADLRILFPGYETVFCDTCGISSLSVLTTYPTPADVINAPKDEVIKVIKGKCRKGADWLENTYSKLLSVALDASQVAFCNNALRTSLIMNIKLINTLDEQIAALLDEIEATIKSDDTPKWFKQNMELLVSLPGVGFITAVTIVSEIGDFSRFKKPKQLVAFFGIDPSVNESGQFKGTQNKMSKRGTRFGRRALYAIALACTRKTTKGTPVNSVLYDYKNKNLTGKKKKVAIGAIMHKILKYIFAVLRDQVPYEFREPRIHNQMCLASYAKKAS
jgi:transposase